ncbi:MAG TPA: hypothetical protein DET40_24120 [Lentisphaeria bacterium]|nr:MAG: hypothetical protein A2X45_08945 [Lentisphaerae bacterium GWF2_50_93]HCE46646.1 hypothetical protein [Lentisphaeria bacterium]
MRKNIKFICCAIFFYSILLSAQAAPDRASASSAKLADGKETPCVILSNESLTVKFLPEIGGKIISIKDSSGNEYLDRGTKAYSGRFTEMTYNDTEFDGIDEVFPTMTECKMPAGEFKGAKLHPHGDLYRKKWTHSLDNGTLSMETSGFELPYIFKRTAKLDKSSLVLDYTVTNNSKEPLPYIYTFHPIFSARTGSRLELPAEMNVKVSYSMKGWLGKGGESRKLGEIKNEDGTPFLEKMFTSSSGRYWKFFTEKLTKGEVILSHEGSSKLVMAWPADMFPYLAVWCSEGNVGGQNHIAPEPSVSMEESLEKAYAAGEARSIPAKGTEKWQIRISIMK